MSAGLEFFFAAVSIILLVGCLFVYDRSQLSNRIMIIMLIMNAVMNAVDACVWILCDAPAMLIYVKVWSFISYFVGCAMFAMFSFLLISCIGEHTAVAKWVPKVIVAQSLLMVFMWLISLFNGMYYYWDQNGVCQHGELFWLSQMLGAVLLVLNILMVLAYRRALTKRVSIAFIFYSVMPLSAIVLWSVWEVTPVYMAFTLSLLLYFIIVRVEREHSVARQKIRLARQDLELARSRTAIMLTQIQPHFLYNALSSIAQLCEKDPKTAKAMIIQFSEYLHQNMRSLSQETPIPFEQELEHVKIYLSIAQMRFGDELHIAYDIETTDFCIPPLCLQPIVENAVNHGVGMKEDGGTVTISTRALSGHYEITVRDDGVGFCPDAVLNDGHTHIGIQNVRERLKELCGAAMLIQSVVGRGTNVTISVPAKEAKA